MMRSISVATLFGFARGPEVAVIDADHGDAGLGQGFGDILVEAGPATAGPEHREQVRFCRHIFDSRNFDQGWSASSLGVFAATPCWLPASLAYSAASALRHLRAVKSRRPSRCGITVASGTWAGKSFDAGKRALAIDFALQGDPGRGHFLCRQ